MDVFVSLTRPLPPLLLSFSNADQELVKAKKSLSQAKQLLAVGGASGVDAVDVERSLLMALAR